MKLVHALSVISLLSAFAFKVQAEEYKAPKIRWKSNRAIPAPKAAQTEDFKDFGENKYRVQEDPFKEREIASEEKKEGRDPSSTDSPEEKNTPESKEAVKNFKPIPSPRHWDYQK